jgi:hypothetical protein
MKTKEHIGNLLSIVFIVALVSNLPRLALLILFIMVLVHDWDIWNLIQRGCNDKD